MVDRTSVTVLRKVVLIPEETMVDESPRRLFVQELWRAIQCTEHMFILQERDWAVALRKACCRAVERLGRPVLAER
jgi:hypothetical protein